MRMIAEVQYPDVLALGGPDFAREGVLKALRTHGYILVHYDVPEEVVLKRLEDPIFRESRRHLRDKNWQDLWKKRTEQLESILSERDVYLSYIPHEKPEETVMRIQKDVKNYIETLTAQRQSSRI